MENEFSVVDQLNSTKNSVEGNQFEGDQPKDIDRRKALKILGKALAASGLAVVGISQAENVKAQTGGSAHWSTGEESANSTPYTVDTQMNQNPNSAGEAEWNDGEETNRAYQNWQAGQEEGNELGDRRDAQYEQAGVDRNAQETGLTPEDSADYLNNGGGIPPEVLQQQPTKIEPAQKGVQKIQPRGFSFRRLFNRKK